VNDDSDTEIRPRETFGLIVYSYILLYPALRFGDDRRTYVSVVDAGQPSQQSVTMRTVGGIASTNVRRAVQINERPTDGQYVQPAELMEQRGHRDV